MKLFFSVVFTFYSLSVLSQDITISTNKPNATYEAGEWMTFEISPNVSGPAQYEIRFSDQSKVLKKGDLNLVAGESLTIPFTVDEPCFTICIVHYNGVRYMGGAAFSPYDMKEYEPEPDDFDAFWDSMKLELAQVPIDPVLTFISQTSASISYRVNLANIEGRRIYGYISIPTTEGPYPAVLRVPAYGSAPGNAAPTPYVSENLGVISMSISIHNTEPDTEDPNAYKPDDYSNEDKNYYRWSVLAAIRSIDYIFSRDDFDGSQLAVIGTSQGGGLAIMTAGIDERVKLLMNDVPALCLHHGFKYDRAGGFPFYIQNSRQFFESAAHEQATTEATKYYDALYFAKRFSGPSLSLFGYIDQVCPPQTGYSANNQLLGTKIITHARDQGHEAHFGIWDWYRFMRNHFTNLVPFSTPVDTIAWYHLDAGDDQVLTTFNTSLSANLTNNHVVVTDLPIYWEKASGPGMVSFSAPNAYATQATFSQKGTYLLRAVVHDETTLSTDARWYSIVDHLEVIVE